MDQIDFEELNKIAISQPLIKHIYTADPSAHVFEGKIYIYPSHDIEAGIAFNDNGDHFGMEDYHVISMDNPNGVAVDNGLALHVNDVPWAERQMWAPDAATKNGKFYLYFPAKKADGIFQIGVAISDSAVGPFVAEPEPITGSYSIDPAVFCDDDGSYYMYFGGIWGGQMQSYRENKYDAEYQEPMANEKALNPKIAKLSSDMKSFAETVKEIEILDENGNSLLAGDNERRFFEASWMHKFNGKYYFSYSTGDTHFICYAIGDNPYGPFLYQGRILNPVVGWTSHHSICEFENKWYLFYHDSSLSKGITHLRSIKVAEIKYDAYGKIQTLDPYNKKASRF
ncbi:alpha-N-arabinofuranosidase [Flavobacterium cellulosilyticum]|uniref:Alpha-N-arabinofuranosidase n=1 Tax=Flavobacterium cellulosilyticum TaxID=2541731 RepID=A0A4R5CQJ7_9FLAO|nr:alpha-N-arabinofuranosidase [Flavobacterium cellulosilyticum]